VAELRWVLLGLGLIALVGIYAYSRYRAGRPDRPAGPVPARVEPGFDSEIPDVGDDEGSPEPPLDAREPRVPEPPEKLVTIRLMSRDKAGFPADRLVLALRGTGLRHGRFGIFHAHPDGEPDTVLFSVANLVEPGSFDLSGLSDSRLPGVSFFLVLPGAGQVAEALEAMLDTAHQLASALDGELLDEQGSSLSVQRERYIRDEVQQYVREYLSSAAARGIDE
jgi:cell division protein ZipA